ncbi:MAG: sodium:proton antiporter [Bacteroidetes bacterium]|nr:MAG: sodium:proton antiporter [Bacteroidota bacterium]
MVDILLNPVVVSVVVMCVICLLRFNVMLAIIVAAITAGLMAGIPVYSSEGDNVMSMLISGMGGNSATALSYILLGAFAYGLAKSGLGQILSQWIAKRLSGKRFVLIFAIAGIACFSQNLVPVHIAFIPILIPPLIGLFNRLKIDRRALASALTFGLKAPYVAVPLGFGLLFHGILAENISLYGLEVSVSDVTSVMWIGGLSMLAGLIFVVFALYGRKREYADLPVLGVDEESKEEVKMTPAAWAALAGCVVTAVVSLITESLPISALAGLATMIVSGGIKYKDIDLVMDGGIKMMGFIAFIMLVAAGYGNVLTESGAVKSLVDNISGFMVGSKPLIAFVLLMVGLLITMGIGTSFGTIPILAPIYVPLGITLGLSTGSIILLIGVAAALGDAGSPASDSTLGPTSGLNADGQHNHIWDTCVPTFIAYDIPLVIGAVIAVGIMG